MSLEKNDVSSTSPVSQTLTPLTDSHPHILLPLPRSHHVLGQSHAHCLCEHCPTLMDAPLPLRPPQTCSLRKLDHYFLLLLEIFLLVLESRLNLLKEPTSLGAISLPTAQPHSHHTPPFQFSSHSGLYPAPSPQDLCIYCSLCLSHLLFLLALVNSCSSFKSFSEKMPDLADQVKTLHWHHKPLLQSPITQHVSFRSVWLMT